MTVLAGLVRRSALMCAARYAAPPVGTSTVPASVATTPDSAPASAIASVAAATTMPLLPVGGSRLP